MLPSRWFWYIPNNRLVTVWARVGKIGRNWPIVRRNGYQKYRWRHLPFPRRWRCIPILSLQASSRNFAELLKFFHIFPSFDLWDIIKWVYVAIFPVLSVYFGKLIRYQIYWDFSSFSFKTYLEMLLQFHSFHIHIILT